MKRTPIEPRLPALPSCGPTIFGADGCACVLSLNEVYSDVAVRNIVERRVNSKAKIRAEGPRRGPAGDARAGSPRRRPRCTRRSGVGQTTVADIARRAGVQRLTVYNHFPDLDALLPACTAHWLARASAARPRARLRARGPAERLRAVLTAQYGWYRETAVMQRRVLGERATVPELDAWMARSSDVAARRARRARWPRASTRPQARALVALALDFWTWQRLDREGLDDDAAADADGRRRPAARRI